MRRHVLASNSVHCAGNKLGDPSPWTSLGRDYIVGSLSNISRASRSFSVTTATCQSLSPRSVKAREKHARSGVRKAGSDSPVCRAQAQAYQAASPIQQPTSQDPAYRSRMSQSRYPQRQPCSHPANVASPRGEASHAKRVSFEGRTPEGPWTRGASGGARAPRAGGWALLR